MSFLPPLDNGHSDKLPKVIAVITALTGLLNALRWFWDRLSPKKRRIRKAYKRARRSRSSGNT